MRRGLKRKILLYKLFEEEISKRDGYICKKCGSTELVHAHNIISKFDEMPYHGFILENGIMLCKSCREKAKKNKEDYKTDNLYDLINSSKYKVLEIFSKKKKIDR